MSYLLPVKEYYSLKELEPIVDIKYRQLLVRVKKVYSDYKDTNDKLIYKKSNVWYIQKKLVSRFFTKRKPIEYKLFVTIASKNHFDKSYWSFIIKYINKELKKIDKSYRVKYVIETNKNNINHLHFKTNYDKLRILKRMLSVYILTNKSNDMNVDIKYIYEIEGLKMYFSKQNTPVLLK